VNAVGQIRQTVRAETNPERRYLMIVMGTTDRLGLPVPVEVK
jgi:hypothetical protein